MQFWMHWRTNVTDVRRGENSIASEQNKKRTLTKGSSFNMGDAKCSCACRRTKLSGRRGQGERVRKVGRG